MDIELLAKVQSTILILGETGTGKTTLAKRIHNSSSRRRNNFVSVNLAGLTDELFVSELFGHCKGSFTGAHCDKKGYCDLVGNGTLFLDEIGDLSPMQQKYLLKLIDEKRFTAIGGLKEKEFEGAIIMATHKDLKKEAREGRFREDLYFRVRVFTETLEPVRNNPYLIKSKIDEFLRNENTKNNSNKYFAEDTLKILADHDWPGNYREMKSAIEYACLRSKSSKIERDSLPDWLEISEKNNCCNYKAKYSEFEKNYLIKQLVLNNGKINETARKTGISKVTLISKIKKYTIDLEYIKIVNQANKFMGLTG